MLLRAKSPICGRLAIGHADASRNPVFLTSDIGTKNKWKAGYNLRLAIGYVDTRAGSNHHRHQQAIEK
ncbi:hypothetical protein CQ13_32200 [Bradyrhizobium retamae]|uniref:Uncharacterized protein n=1 Tax=Bradyrhizobium retamae TaxID=1300035 RepID=A0A0R3MKI7_9BRAD|nr:hypothetical protein CQ13_32200 [Bradyrhizobium retamae]